MLARGQLRGFLGPGPVEAQIEHSLGFYALVPRAPQTAVDLGSGGGVPGLVLAEAWPESRWVLLDVSRRRTTFLTEAVEALGLGHRIEVITQRAELTGRDPARRARADLVVARSFGRPAVTAECAAPLLRKGGSLVVAEPPGGAPARWPPAPLALLGLVPDGRQTSPFALQRLLQAELCPPRYPRRTGVPAKRPLY
ncbi:MAG TPA: RsmG family class I SAM-dependent methyltransferase [Acidimicrobiales bacterium]|nr:RsmG family class I SAM-dependent methyltransferase [Acidimicrobiales bacterium]